MAHRIILAQLMDQHVEMWPSGFMCLCYEAVTERGTGFSKPFEEPRDVFTEFLGN